ncbi:SAM-dependent methyltransferase [Chromatiaceae bacterium AAb-1]|nr:SAM-dependent methyltransferase [Chromatiaceae bacterium AAb-1]
MPENSFSSLHNLSLAGLGIQAPGQTTVFIQSLLQTADRIFYLLADPIAEQWLISEFPDSISLQPHYHNHPARQDAYLSMIEQIMAALRQQHIVVVVLYGHPGVFASMPHWLTRQARQESFSVKMYPGISAEDCLIADLGLDPGAKGIMHLEATQFLFYQQTISVHSPLVLWQVGVTGDITGTQFATGQQERAALVQKLRRYYPPNHQVILYEAATLALYEPRIEQLFLDGLVTAAMSQITTLVIPALSEPAWDNEICALLGKETFT